MKQMEAAARKAVVEKRMGRPSRNASVVMAHVAFTGVRVRRLTAAHTWCKGTPLSRDSEYSILRSTACCVSALSLNRTLSNPARSSQEHSAGLQLAMVGVIALNPLGRDCRSNKVLC